ncbi:MAG: hypothetical protein ACXWF8_16760 [Methylobacter sp.]
MNRTFIQNVLLLSITFSVQAVPASTAEGTLAAAYKEPHAMNADASRYVLPPSKKFIGACRQRAQLLHPGTVEKQQMLNRHGNFWLRYEIRAQDGSEWLVLCDLAKGEIANEQKLIDGAL